ncbi:MAG: hypothetical protein QOG31_26 [Thermoplasmata archaeon]|jgi:hypothetical protein|nr:hypothetical protein [Thermoplasmata archaeon]
MEPRFAQCPECGNRFDAALTGFCTRCGATAPPPGAPGAPGSAPAPWAPPRRDPLRRRVQVGGILLATWGALLAIACIAFAVLPASVLSGYLGQVVDGLGDTPLPGGELHVQVLANGTAAQNATVEVRSPAGNLTLAARTDAAGWANVTLREHAAANLTVRSGGHVLERRVIVRDNDTLEVRLDVARDPASVADRIGLDRLVSVLRIGATVLGVGALLLLAGGIAALAVRWPVLAIAGPVPVLALTVLLAVATLSVGMFVILVLQAVGVALVVSGRPAFRRR